MIKEHVKRRLSRCPFWLPYAMYVLALAVGAGVGFGLVLWLRWCPVTSINSACAEVVDGDAKK